MSTQPRTRELEMVELEIDGHPLTAPKGSMIIQTADADGIPIPRFCYHPKLPIAAVCRQCMVEVEMGGKRIPKPQVACATPVAQGMKVFTKSKLAIKAQQNALEFVLINHPLDCPICDQGGECELQDLTMGYGRSLSRLNIRKRTVADEDIGTLVATYMTRCIHCTRCVRFLGDIAGTYEFGDFNRGDSHLIGTYIGSGVASELSGNIIDVCPVGALTDKVFEFRGRPWELIAKPSIGYHDALGSNLWLHTKRGEVLRAVPRENEAVNECWLADRDRYSHPGLYALDRAMLPRIRRNGELVDVVWDEAIEFVAAGLRQSGADVAALVAPLASCEEGHLLSSLLRGLGSTRIDHRLRVQDFSDGGPQGGIFEMPVDQLAHIGAALIVGGNPRHEIPLVNHRLRDATRFDVGKVLVSNLAAYDIAIRHGAKVFVLNPLDFDFNFELAGKRVVAPQHLVARMLQLAKAAGVTPDAGADPRLSEALDAADHDQQAVGWLGALKDAASSVVILGDIAVQHPQASWLRVLARLIAKATDSAYDEFPSGANAIGLARAGALPDDPLGTSASILEHPPASLITWQAEAEDFALPAAFVGACTQAAFHVHAGAYASEEVLRSADAILPIGLPPEVDGSYVNVDGFVQDSPEGARLPGEARAGWKVLRALGDALGIPGFGFVDWADVRGRIRDQLDSPAPPRSRGELGRPPEGEEGALIRAATVGIYRTDAVVRRARALQEHVLNRSPGVRLNPAEARSRSLSDGQTVAVNGVRLHLKIDRSVPEGCAWIEAGDAATRSLPPDGAALSIQPAGA